VKHALPAGEWGTPLAHDRIARLRRDKEAAELKRLFYVAVTRARDHLVLSGEGKGEWRRWMDAFREGEAAHLLRVSPAGELLAAAAAASSPPSEAPEAALPDPELLSRAVQRSLDFMPPRPSAMTFSPTALEDYRHCPRKYFFKAVMGLDEGLFADLLGTNAGRKVPAPRHDMTAIDKGNLAHRLLEDLDFAAPPDARRSQCRELAPLVAPGPDGRGTAEVIDRVLAFAASPTGRELAAKRLLREHPFILKFRGKADYYLRGAMDLVAVDGETATVYDYKYLAAEGADLDGYRFQLRTYMLALAKVWPEKRIEGRLVFLKGGGEEAVACDAAPFTGELLQIMDAIRERSAEEEFLLRAGCDGRHCPFRERCRAGTTQS
jgi:ATP-dependent exoDNAse (exonuclease V) beta subunit